MYPYRQYITVKSMDDPDLKYWRDFHDAPHKSIPWAITRGKQDNEPIYTLWVWGSVLRSHDDCHNPQVRCHVSAIVMDGHGFANKLRQHLAKEPRRVA